MSIRPSAETRDNIQEALHKLFLNIRIFPRPVFTKDDMSALKISVEELIMMKPGGSIQGYRSPEFEFFTPMSSTTLQKHPMAKDRNTQFRLKISQKSLEKKQDSIISCAHSLCNDLAWQFTGAIRVKMPPSQSGRGLSLKWITEWRYQE